MISLQAKFKYTMSSAELETYVSKEEDQVIKKLKEALRPCEGVDDVLVKLEKEGKYKLSVVSSSALRRVKASIEKVGQDKYFDRMCVPFSLPPIYSLPPTYLLPPFLSTPVKLKHKTDQSIADHVFSAATSLPTPTSKPDPAIYIYAMSVLSVQPSECVAIEDSRSGATAAFRANIKTVGYVGSYPEEEQAKMTKVLEDAGVVVVMKDWKEFEGVLAGIEGGSNL